MSTRYIIRFDDIVPEMSWKNFSYFDVLSAKYDLPYVVGVVPDNKDPSLKIGPKKPDFWATVRSWRKRGWTIAQHGFTHEYVTKNPGLLNIHPQSEFAGLSYDQQYQKLAEGKRLLQQQGVWQPVFMAPSHSFDKNTLLALQELNFTSITDGYGIYPYYLHGLTAVPQLASTPKTLGIGVYTICLHINTMTQAQISKMAHFIEKNHEKIISFESAEHIKPKFLFIANLIRTGTQISLQSWRWLRKA
jgi:predicted deacetylase